MQRILSPGRFGRGEISQIPIKCGAARVAGATGCTENGRKEARESSETAK